MLTLIQEFETTVQVWIRELAYYSPAALRESPGHSQWSMGQVYQYLIDDVQFHIHQVRQCFTADAVTAGIPTEEGQRKLARNSFPESGLIYQ